MGTKGIQPRKGQGEIYTSPKKRITISLSPELIRLLGAEVDRLRGQKIRISRSQLIENLLRDHLMDKLAEEGLRWASPQSAEVPQHVCVDKSPQ